MACARHGEEWEPMPRVRPCGDQIVAGIEKGFGPAG